MKLKKFKEKNPIYTRMIVVSTVLVIFTAVLILYKSFALYEQRNSFEIVNGQVPDQNYDAMLSFYVDDGNGNQSFVESMPTENGHNYTVTVTCNNGAIGEWDYENWQVKNLKVITSRTKCKLIFGLPKPKLIDIVKSITPVTIGNGLYEVIHEDAEITYTSDTNIINNLKQTEYRYAGKNPNNYVTFNGEEAGWRMIGLVNTPEGQRLKLVRANSIGDYSWDSSASTINYGYGVNEWSQADLMATLNSGGAYYNKTSGTCYNGGSNSTTSCDFSSIGLTSETKEMIDTITWNTGSQGSSSTSTYQTTNMYNYERSNNTGKICSGGGYCNDSVTRTTTWRGQIGLMYPSDYGYATSGGVTTNRNTCMITSLNLWNSNGDCYENDWIFNSSTTWFISPYAYSSDAENPFVLDIAGHVGGHLASLAHAVHPTLYLKSDVNAVSGDGTIGNPYVLNM